MFGFTEARRLFIEDVTRGYRPGFKTGALQFLVGSGAEGRFFAELGSEVRFQDGTHPHPQCVIRATEEAFAQLTRSNTADRIDGMDVQGDRDVAMLALLALQGQSTPGWRRLHALVSEVDSRGGSPFDVQRTGLTGAAALLRALSAGQPLVIEGALRGGGWDLSAEQVCERYGDLPLTALDAEVLGAHLALERVRDLLQGPAVRDGQSLPVYSGGCTLPGPMQEDYLLPLLQANCYTRPQLWMGHRAVTRLHRDFLLAFIGEVWGVKQFVLYPPEDAPLLDCGACFEHFQLALFDALAPQAFEQSAARGAHRLEIELRAGETLVLPAGWFHAVSSTGPVMSVNRFMREQAWTALTARLRPAGATSPAPHAH